MDIILKTINNKKKIASWIGFETLSGGSAKAFLRPKRVLVAYKLSDVTRVVSQAEALAASENLHAIGCLSYEAAPAFEAAASVHGSIKKTNESDVVNDIQPQSSFPLAWFALYENENVVPCSSPSKLTALVDSKEKNEARKAASFQNEARKAASFRVSPWTPDCSRSEYDDAIASIRTSILDGDFYQVNHTLRLRANFDGSTTLFHSRLLEAQRCGFGAYLNMDTMFMEEEIEENGQVFRGERSENTETKAKKKHNSWYQVLSASPELFFHWKRSSSNELYSRPMKGTRRRGLSSSQDAVMQTELAASLKDRAENLMIVDLLRNDMSRVAAKGTVRVRDLFRIEKYPTVLQMTSGVYCTPKQGTRLVDVLRALFPCGSITGAPKLSAMKAIASIESSPRRPYCGMVIQIDPGEKGDISASVPIRTVLISRDDVPHYRGDKESKENTHSNPFDFDDAPPGSMAEYGVGGGITWDSTANGEFDEVLSKAAVLFAASARGEEEGNVNSNSSTSVGGGGQSLGLFETLRYSSQSSTYLYKTLHIQRLRDSCNYFGISLNADEVEEALHEVIAEKRSETSHNLQSSDYRIRLHIAHNGKVSTTISGPLGDFFPSSLSKPRLCILDTAHPVNSKIVHLYHKTTERGVYDKARAFHNCLVDDRRPANPDAITPFDVLLVNEHGHLTEFCIGNVIVEMSDSVGLSEGSIVEEGDKDEGVIVKEGESSKDAEHLGEDLWPQPSPGCSFFTPPISSGLLPGVLRSRLIHLNKVKTRIINKTELECFKRVWLVNSVRGWVQVCLECT